MMNPILPASTGGGTDPALEGRVALLETDVGNLQNVKQALVEENKSGFSTVTAIGATYDVYLMPYTTMSKLGVLDGAYDFTINDQAVSVDVLATDTVDDVLVKAYNIGFTMNVYFSMQVFGGQIQIQVMNGDKIEFPNNTLWNRLGLTYVVAQSSPISAAYALSAFDVYDSLGNKIADSNMEFQQQLGVLASGVARANGLELRQQQISRNIASIFGDRYDLLETTDLSPYVSETDTIEFTLNGSSILVEAGADRTVSGLLNAINVGLQAHTFGIYARLFAGAIRFDFYDQDAEFSIVGGSFATTLGFYFGASLSFKAATTFPVSLDASGIIDAFNGMSTVSDLIYVLRSENNVLSNRLQHLTYEIEQLKAAANV